MKKDKNKTRVEFYIATYQPTECDEQPTKEILAVFVDENILADKEKMFDCYAHIGQHSTCSEGFLKQNCKKCTKKEQYQDLFNELENLVGYNLEVID